LNKQQIKPLQSPDARGAGDSSFAGNAFQQVGHPVAS
jgi:hypothetical protein